MLPPGERRYTCLLYTSDAADDLTRVDLGGRRIIKKRKKKLRNVWQNLAYSPLGAAVSPLANSSET